MSWVNPKLDWKESDYYNAADLNRVENNTIEVINYLVSIQYNVPLIITKTDRDNTAIDYLSSINRVENNIEAIKNAFITPPGWLNKKVWTLDITFDFKDAKRLEQNLQLLYSWALIVKENQIYCGTFDCGAEWEGGLF